jgi:hypothetical protein
MVPKGTVIKDAREVMPETDIFAYKVSEGAGSFSAFSNCFRYKLLYERGGWWSDTDVVALKPYDFNEEYVFASERDRQGGSFATTCVIKCPPGSEIMRYCWEQSTSHNRETVGWGTIGPQLLAASIDKYNLRRFIRAPETFCPYDWFLAEVDPEGQCMASEGLLTGHAIHLWNEMWRRLGLDKNAKYDENSLYEKLKNDILHIRL